MELNFDDSKASVMSVGEYHRHAAPAREDAQLLKLTYSPVSVQRGAEHVRYGIVGIATLAGKDFFRVEQAVGARALAMQLAGTDPKADPKRFKDLSARLALLIG